MSMAETPPPLSAQAARELLGAALSAARSAGALVEKGWRSRPAPTHKGQLDLVTQFDFDSETLLRRELSRAASFPVVGEEQGGERPRDPQTPTWFVDPIDGTTNFVHGHPFWCVSVGLAAGGCPVLGAVVAPSLRMEWTGIAQEGTAAERDGAPCRVSEALRLQQALLATGFPYDRHINPDNNFDAFVAIKKKCLAVRRCGSAAIDLCFVGDGTYDGYWEHKVKPWDIVAGSAVVLAAGGRVTGYDGRPIDVTKGDVVATNGQIHEELLMELSRVRQGR
jgi:myo-inositol-1(or 4)-monophosphatase